MSGLVIPTGETMVQRVSFSGSLSDGRKHEMSISAPKGMPFTEAWNLFDKFDNSCDPTTPSRMTIHDP